MSGPRVEVFGTWDAACTVDDDELVLTVANRTGEPARGGVRVRLGVPAGDPWWLVPGAFYGENRVEACARPYPRFEAGRDAPADHAALVSSWWEFRLDRCAYPVVCAWGDHAGIALEVPTATALGLPGLGFGLGVDGAEVWATFPYREGPVTYVGSGSPDPPDITTHTLAPGEEATVRLRWHTLPGYRGSHRTLLRAVHARLAPASPLRPWEDLATTARLTAHGLLRWHYDPDPGVLLETAAFDRALTGRDGEPLDRQAMHVGWVSGVPWAYALARHGARAAVPDALRAAERVIDFICDNPAPCGTFWGVWYRASGWRQSWSFTKDALHARTLGEATTFLARALRDLPDLAAEHPGWAAAVRRNLVHRLGVQDTTGNLGTLHHAVTGAVLDRAGAAGLMWVAAFCEAAALPAFADLPLVEAARRAGEHYAHLVEAEFLHGAPEDIDLAPSSEDGYAAVMAYVALHRATGEDRWLDLARRAADWTLTFRYAWNVTFPPHTILATYGYASRGADQASPCNQHLHTYGLVCHTELHELATALGDPYYAERADEALAAARQFVARENGDFNAMRGMVTERFYQTNCFEAPGSVLTLSHAWCVGVLLLACEDAIRAQQ